MRRVAASAAASPRCGDRKGPAVVMRRSLIHAREAATRRVNVVQRSALPVKLKGGKRRGCGQ